MSGYDPDAGTRAAYERFRSEILASSRGPVAWIGVFCLWIGYRVTVRGGRDAG